MQKLIFFTLSLFFVFISWSQKRFEVPGTHASIVQPTNILTQPYFSAFTLNDKYEMSIMEFNENFSVKLKNFNTDEYRKKGITVYDESSITIDGYDAKLIHVYSNPEANAIQCLFGDTTFFILASTLYDKNDKALYLKIIDDYKTLKIDKLKRINWDNFLAFNYDKNNSFKFINPTITSINLIFSRSSVSNEIKGSKIIALQNPNYGIFKTVQDYAVYALKAYVNTNYEIDEVINEKIIDLNGKKVYEFKFSAINNKKEKHIFHTIFRITDATAIGLIATIEDNKDEDEIEKFIRKVSFKN